MPLLICPGIHSPELTTQFLHSLQLEAAQILDARQIIVVPGDRYPVYSGWHVAQFLRETLANQVVTGSDGQDLPIVMMGFSAGVVGVATAAHLWQSGGGTVQALIAIDGWGVPLYGNFPIHRVSHNAFTHWSSSLLEPSQLSFYADPAVSHLSLWQSPASAIGWAVRSKSCAGGYAEGCSSLAEPTRTTAAAFIAELLCQYLDKPVIGEENFRKTTTKLP